MKPTLSQIDSTKEFVSPMLGRLLALSKPGRWSVSVPENRHLVLKVQKLSSLQKGALKQALEKYAKDEITVSVEDFE